MTTLVFLSVLLFVALWAWLAFEYSRAIPLTAEEEIEQENWMAMPPASFESSSVDSSNLKTVNK
ncbi:hypothetical protein [Olivibacter sp. XZL3]|uniref:hypothetical protein n=1 Tax=Olivibacter sp. XZL3 TaxID=1735116 RepID=UPI0010658872|nr:hypothetical protein [Olivibacter sp. XZL3]